MTNNKAHIIIDMLYDFIDGSMACLNSHKAVNESISYINSHPEYPTFYIADSHPSNHCSFIANGGIWPPHCVKGSHGAQIHNEFYTVISKPQQRPNDCNILTKGEDPAQEQYSGFEARHKSGVTLEELLKQQGINEVYLTGIATEFCVNATALDLQKAGFSVFVIERALAYVNRDGHKETIEFLRKNDIAIL